jgi:tripartite-type tricarboxylate transporter receptor subunit TctC
MPAAELRQIERTPTRRRSSGAKYNNRGEIMHRRGNPALIVALLACFAAAGAAAQTYPVKTVRIIVPFAPGGSNDILARVIGQKLTEAWGQQVIAENRPGGGTVIGTEVVAKSAPDGYTLLMVSPSHSTNPTLLKKLPYDTFRDLAPIILVAHSSNVLLSHPSLPARSVKELIALARSRPDQITYASGGNGTSTHLSGELLAQRAGVKMVHVPYKGAAPALLALLSGQVTWIFSNAIPSVPHLKAGRLRALAVTGAKPNPVLPDVPTLMSTLPGFEVYTWYGIAAQGSTPKDLVARINRDIARILESSEMRSRIAAEGAETRGGTPEDFSAFLRAEIDKWAVVIRKAGIRLE